MLSKLMKLQSLLAHPISQVTLFVAERLNGFSWFWCCNSQLGGIHGSPHAFSYEAGFRSVEIQGDDFAFASTQIHLERTLVLKGQFMAKFLHQYRVSSLFLGVIPIEFVMELHIAQLGLPFLHLTSCIGLEDGSLSYSKRYATIHS